MDATLRLETALVVVLTLGCTDAFGQVEEVWVVRYEPGADETSRSEAVDVDADGNVYVTGAAGDRIVTVKYDRGGRERWVVRRNDDADGGPAAPAALVVNDSGDVYVTGGIGVRFAATPLAPCTIQAGADECSDQVVSRGILTLKYDADGAELWQALHGRDGWHAVVGLATDDAGSLYVGATSFAECGSVPCAGGDYLVIKYDSEGNELWAARYDGGGEDRLAGIVVDAVGSVLVTGSSASVAAADYATVKFDSEGHEMWSRRWDGGADDRAVAIVVDTEGDVFVTGGASTPGDAEASDFVTVKYDVAGRELWARRFDGAFDDQDRMDWPVAMAAGESGAVVLTGGVGLQCGIGCTPRQYATVSYSAAGEELWVARYGGRDAFHHMDEVVAVEVDAVGNAYVAGTVLPWGEGHHIVTLKYGRDGERLWTAHHPGSVTGVGSYGRKVLVLGEDASVVVTGTSAAGVMDRSFVTVKYVQGARFRRADSNEDGTVDISDAIITLGALFLGKGQITCDDASDANDDGLVDISDPIVTLQVLFLGQGVIPAPGTDVCGPDPTDDGLGCEEYGECE